MFALFGDAADDAGEVVRRTVVTVLASAASAALAFAAGRWYGQYKAGKEWHAKEFMDRIIVSLNVFADGALKIRTVLERSLDEVFLNPVAVGKVRAAARATTKENPLMPVAKEDRWFLLNFVLNAVAEHFVAGNIRQDAGQPVTVVKYALFLTCELVGDERIRKVRAMLVRRDVLENFPYPDTLPVLENHWHDDRIKTLRAAAAAFATEPDQFLMLEVCV